MDKGSIKKDFLTFCLSRGLRMTGQRLAILDAVFDSDQHFSADQLVQRARQRDKSVSRATVYRTLSLLVKSGLVREMDFGKAFKFYDPNYTVHPNHNHIICQDCGKIVEFDTRKIAELELEVGRELGFTVKSHRLQLVATCDQFQRLGFCDRREGKVRS